MGQKLAAALGVNMFAKHSISAAVAAPTGTLGAVVLCKSAQLGAALALGLHSRSKWAPYVGRPFLAPALRTRENPRTGQPFIEAEVGTEHKVFFDWQGQPIKAPHISNELRGLSNGGLSIEGSQNDDQYSPQRKKWKIFTVEMQCPPNPGAIEEPLPEITISKCYGRCNKRDTCYSNCKIDIQKCRSHPELTFATFTLSPNGKIAIGCNNGAILILNRTNGEDTRVDGWLRDYTRDNDGTPVHQEIKDHQVSLRTHTNRTTASNASAAATIASACS